MKMDATRSNRHESGDKGTSYVSSPEMTTYKIDEINSG